MWVMLLHRCWCTFCVYVFLCAAFKWKNHNYIILWPRYCDTIVFPPLLSSPIPLDCWLVSKHGHVYLYLSLKDKAIIYLDLKKSKTRTRKSPDSPLSPDWNQQPERSSGLEMIISWMKLRSSNRNMTQLELLPLSLLKSESSFPPHATILDV